MGVVAGTGCISANPLYVSTTNLTLTSSSPARRSDASAMDMGALPYGGIATPGLYGTLWSDTTVPAGVTASAGDLTVAPGVTLTLSPGATITFGTNDIMQSGADTSRAELIVQGTLQVAGTAMQPVTLDSSGTSMTSWYGIRARPGSTTTLAGVVVAEAYYGLRGEGGALSTTQNVTVRGCQEGAHAESGNLSLAGVDFTGNSTGVALAATAGTVTIDHVTIAHSGLTGLAVSGGTATVTSSIVALNPYGISRSAGTVTVTSSNVWGNTGYNYSGVVAGAGCIQANPLFVGTSNHRLTSNSPSRFTGAAGSDMGALPYVSDATPGLYGTLWTDTTVAAGVTSVAGDLTVAPSVTLTLSPGATLSFATNDVMQAYDDTSRAELRIEGRVLANGTALAPVTLTSSGTSSTSWYGVRFLSGSSGTQLSGAIIEEAYYGLRGEGGAATLDALTIRTCQYGARVVSGGMTISNSVFTGNSTAFNATSTAGATTLLHCTLSNNTLTAITVEGGALQVQSTIVSSNPYGISRSAGTVTVTYSDVWGNTGYNYSGVVAGAGTISVNPFFAGASDFHLGSTSPCIDAATAMGAPNHDRDFATRPLDGDGAAGAGYDIGAYEYARMTVCGDGTVGAGETCDDGVANGTYGHCNSMCSGLGARCGDGMTNGPETCDDGNANDTDACLSTCVAASCGDGHVRTGVEQCDDGNSISTDACTSTCTTARCGDSVVWAGMESCDDGNMDATDACIACAAARCGDGYVRAGMEACDDGNTSDSDACTSSCALARCGDGIVGPGETCDDGNTVDTDACSNACRPAACGDGVVQMGEQCDDHNMVNDDGCTNACHLPACGDGIRQSGEECDDGNTVNDDTCSATCHSARCGDAIVQSGEQCDDGNIDPADACTSSCQNARCGDGFVRTGMEQCDDGNARDDDGCVSMCRTATCGDGHLRVGVEACDDGNTRDGDGCSATCTLVSCGNGTTDPGEECDDGNSSNVDGCTNGCFLPRCGDGFVRAGVEACDDGNTLDTDACLSTCHVASCGDGFVRAGMEACDDGNGLDTDDCLTSCVLARCGDGAVHDGVEECDDGNTTPQDGCSPSCLREHAADAGVPTGDAGISNRDAGLRDAGVFAGDATTGLDAGRTTTPRDRGGCGCTVPGERGGEPHALAALGLLGLAVAIMRRRRRAAP